MGNGEEGNGEMGNGEVGRHGTWDMLSSHLKDRNICQEQFRSGLKTWLFMQAYLLIGGASENLFKWCFTNARFD